VDAARHRGDPLGYLLIGSVVEARAGDGRTDYLPKGWLPVGPAG
jgi:hypothetical protein